VLFKIAQARVGVLIGRGGRVKDLIEQRLGVQVAVDSQTGDVEVTLQKPGDDPSSPFRARDLITAIGRGFAPEKAYQLLEDDVYLRVIDLRDFFGKSQSEIQRVKGRIIGHEGKTRRILEELTKTQIAVYGHTVAIIGATLNLDVARTAIEMLIKGSLHRTVYRFLEGKRTVLRESEMDIWKEVPPAREDSAG
jgi:ribosomal RNA assembly protein